MCFSARKPACECDCGAKWDRSVNDLGGAARKAQWGTAGLHGGVQNPRCTAGESGTREITNQSWLHQTEWSFRPDHCGFFCGQFSVDTGLDTELSINLSAPLSNVSFRVCAYTGAGRGPWTPTQTLTLISPGEWKSFMYIQQIKTVVDIVWINDEKCLPFLCSHRNGGI